MLIQDKDHILFYGDSITDCGRREPVNNPMGLGSGYVNLIAGHLLSNYPGLGLRISNRGISGNRVYDLEERLEQDVIQQGPTLVSIMIGINDTWRRYDQKVDSPVPEFQASYRRIIEAILGKLGTRLVICEPFLLPVPEDRRLWREDLDPRITAVRELAWEFRVPLLPLDGLFAAAAAKVPAAYWLPDGVHPSLAGHNLIAKGWLDLVTG